MIGSYQERQELQPKSPSPAQLATVGKVYAGGVSLILDGETETRKLYKVNTAGTYRPGDRVLVQYISAGKGSGSYVVVCTIGAPQAPKGGG